MHFEKEERKGENHMQNIQIQEEGVNCKSRCFGKYNFCCHYCWTGAQTDVDGQTKGRKDKQKNRRTEKRTDGRTDRRMFFFVFDRHQLSGRVYLKGARWNRIGGVGARNPI